MPIEQNGNNGMKMKISTSLTKQTNDQTYITQDENDPESSGIIDRYFYKKIHWSYNVIFRENIRLDSKATQNRDKTSGGKRIPPGVRLYNQAKNNPKGKAAAKKKDDAPPKPVLTKNIEDMLVQSNREKWEEIVKTSNVIHEILAEAGIDKLSIVDALFSDPLFKHVLANLLFHAKILGKNKLETFLHDRIKIFIKEYQTDRQIKENLNSIHTRIQERIEKTQELQKEVFW